MSPTTAQMVVSWLKCQGKVKVETHTRSTRERALQELIKGWAEYLCSPRPQSPALSLLPHGSKGGRGAQGHPGWCHHRHPGTQGTDLFCLCSRTEPDSEAVGSSSGPRHWPLGLKWVLRNLYHSQHGAAEAPSFKLTKPSTPQKDTN